MTPTTEPVLTVAHRVSLGTLAVWGDCVVSRFTGNLMIALRERTMGMAIVGEGEDLKRIRHKTKLMQTRVRAVGPDGSWWVTVPDEPQLLYRCDPGTGAVMGQIRFAGRFDPDTRLAVRILSDGDVMLAGCGVPGLQRLRPDGSLVLDYYTLNEAHQKEFAWRGVVALAVDEATGRVALADRYMTGCVLVVEPVAGQVARVRGLAEPSHVEWLADGTLLVLEMGGPRIAQWTVDGQCLGRWRLPVTPWHWLSGDQFAIHEGMWWWVGQRAVEGCVAGV
ncbi:MAG: hypothetical protein ABI743_03575 [bacterium]